MLRLLGFFDDFGYPGELATGTLADHVRASGEPDEAGIVEYLDAGHHLTHFMEAGVDVLTGEVHRHTSGCSSLVINGSWVWRADFAHCLETYHVPLPAAFTARVRQLRHRMPDLVGADFAPAFEEIVLGFGWATAEPWGVEKVLPPPPRTVATRQEFAARSRQERPVGSWGRAPRKPRASGRP
ncbi:MULTISPECIES: hypothetical protein [unclassified Streptomyces]|uniref:hypothetical protein n=1 Tax=unclassified Streptomyces TaxID=2593676 RepID=UPI000F4E7618|nr:MULTISPECIES: hypothetical protein [unclassified Streptomyces]QUC58593.1 hypothetical protein IOD14_18265 [Streptomyces sp. A2-16]